jgi:hypothetical protein
MTEKVNDQDFEENYEAAREEAEADIIDELGIEALAEPTPEELDKLAKGIGLEEVDIDSDAIDMMPAGDTGDNFDNDDDVENQEDDEANVTNLPQALTESYGTGLQGKPSDRAGTYSRRSDSELANDADPILTGGDIDANYEQASVVGDEAVGGTAVTPDQDIVDELGAAVGVEIDDYTDVRINDLLEERDDRRWELDPKSSEDYEERRE